MKKSCVFCNFSDTGVIIYQDKSCYAIISKNPINKHHILVIPTRHYEQFTQMPENLRSHIFSVAQKLSKAIRKVAKPSAITYTFDDDLVGAGYNLVPHFKIHVIPRLKKDLSKINWAPLRSDLTLAARAKLAGELKACLKSSS